MVVALPIPEPRPDDHEDVHWQLSTASALWARGESAEALKWLRRAAETASDENRDARALELAKAAAEFTTRLSAPPPQADATAELSAPPVARRGPVMTAAPNSIDPAAPTVPGRSAPPLGSAPPPLGSAPPPMPGRAPFASSPPPLGSAPPPMPTRSAPPPSPSRTPGGAAAAGRGSAPAGPQAKPLPKTLNSSTSFDELSAQASGRAGSASPPAARAGAPQASQRGAQRPPERSRAAATEPARAPVESPTTVGLAPPAPSATPAQAAPAKPAEARAPSPPASPGAPDAASRARSEVAASRALRGRSRTARGERRADGAPSERSDERARQSDRASRAATVRMKPSESLAVLKRFDESETMEREVTAIGMRFDALDLDEQTNVLEGDELERAVDAEAQGRGAGGHERGFDAEPTMGDDPRAFDEASGQPSLDPATPLRLRPLSADPAMLAAAPRGLQGEVTAIPGAQTYAIDPKLREAFLSPDPVGQAAMLGEAKREAPPRSSELPRGGFTAPLSSVSAFRVWISRGPAGVNLAPARPGGAAPRGGVLALVLAADASAEAELAQLIGEGRASDGDDEERKR